MAEKSSVPRKRPFAYHTLLIGAYYVLNYFSRHYSLYNSTAFIIPLVITVLITALYWGLLYSYTRDLVKAAIVATLTVVIYFSYVHVYLALNGVLAFDVSGHRISPNYVLSPFFVAVLVLSLYFIKRTRRDLHLLTRVLNAACLTLVVLVSVQIGWGYAQAKRAFGEAASAVRAEDERLFKSAKPPEPSELPDIYYIVLDMYVRGDVLQKKFGFDNSEFLGYLEKKGFHVARGATSNYCNTIPSLASSMNFRYIGDVAETMGAGSRNMMPLVYMMRHNRTAGLLRRLGYVYTTFANGIPWWNQDIRESDEYIVEPTVLNWLHEEINFLHNALFRRTAMSAVNGLVKRLTGRVLTQQKLDYRLVRKKVLHVLDTLPRLSNPEAPRFVYAHFSAGHIPQLFGKDGEPIVNNDLTQYVNHLHFLNGKLIEAIDGILKNASRPSVIILQGDHGIYGSRNVGKLEEFAILNAIYMGGKNSRLLYNDITPVNTFRVIFKEYFNMDIELLEDRNYLTPLWNYPYDQTDVTGDL